MKHQSCAIFVLVPKPNGTVHLCLDPIRLNYALFRPVHMGTTVNDNSAKTKNACYLTLIDAGLRYHNWKIGKKSSYLTSFANQYGRYICVSLPNGTAWQVTCSSTKEIKSSNNY